MMSCADSWNVGSVGFVMDTSLYSIANPNQETLSFPAVKSDMKRNPLSLSLSELSIALGGKGRAKACWDFFRLGIDPFWFFTANSTTQQESTLYTKARALMTQNLGIEAMQRYHRRFDCETTSRIVQSSTCQDGTTKLLLELSDGLQVETVIIPWDDRKRSTLCVSSQVGCRQACRFCATGRMGILRSLTVDEILSQVYWARRICFEHDIYPIENVVFMGMGEPADNAQNVVCACNVLVDMFAMAPRRVIVSTVGPTPQAFWELSKAPALLAWSVHASRQEVRKALVPTTRYDLKELRDTGLLKALDQRPKRLRNTMLEVTLLNEVNDSTEDAVDMVQFCQPILQQGVKLTVNLIPWNDINAVQYQPPTRERVLEFQRVLVQNGIQCYIRTTRGDDESAACGQLATSSKRTKRT